ncbi:UDP-3-O-acyl-N-acetylglucosamine deacetylase [Cetobacterium somerae]|uniref:UDP-3-O-acyl-N-acetylglucosamine deacetylase n=1 Tax=Cetobacterium sp. NK01 TaxID=2993530 RepID=UPI002116042D|nr:UDP-3-O-acyl-N-acetylglucosamine deacetylase [Cetobacterium sp. NK01]MCQ8211276.1 UDP-3-O-acyl-N-acetylglucosamine deacetylase [Cetobacterium sp. NK01]
MKRKTLNKEVQYNGIGLHKGEEIKMKLIPSKDGGIIFKRVDLEDGKNIITMAIENTFDLTRGTNLKNEFGATVYTIEHFLSALYVTGITDLIIELDGNELPIGDGSAKVFLEVMENAGIINLDEEVKEIEIKEPLNLTVGDKHIIALPFDGYKITYTIKFDHTFLKSQMLEVVVDLDSYKNEIANARTFGFDYEIDYLKKNNLALGGTLENAIVIKKDGVLNPDGLRYSDEFVRHKILDLIGDLKVLNRPIKGHIIAIKAGHALDIEFAKLLKKQEEKIC